jgi:fermentation-respiration switch protein FrsA (DUF1100 family)
LNKIEVPTLILQGDDDQIVPIGTAALLSSKLVKGSVLKVIPGAPYGMCSTLKEQINAELLAFLQRSFLFPFHKLLPSHILCISSLVLLPIAIYARYSRKLAGAWNPTYSVTAVLAL